MEQTLFVVILMSLIISFFTPIVTIWICCCSKNSAYTKRRFKKSFKRSFKRSFKKSSHKKKGGKKDKIVNPNYFILRGSDITVHVMNDGTNLNLRIKRGKIINDRSVKVLENGNFGLFDKNKMYKSTSGSYNFQCIKSVRSLLESLNLMIFHRKVAYFFAKHNGQGVFHTSNNVLKRASYVMQDNNSNINEQEILDIPPSESIY